MRYKILTVDDSKTVRVIVQRAFRSVDCEVFEATNGEEGLSVAAKELPHLILLDVTMPVMDGVEMLTRLKVDRALKAIPVIMLTAEGGRETVLKIAKMGVRDYLIKPFKESVLLAKAGRVLNLQPPAETGAKPKSITDPANILLLEDRTEIVDAIREGLKHTPWRIRQVATCADANGECAQSVPDLVIANVSLPNDAAFAFMRDLRAHAKWKNVPAFALALQTDPQLQKAQAAGFNAIVMTPLDMAHLEMKITRAMHLDTSQRYYGVNGDTIMLLLPSNCTQAALDEITIYLTPKLTQGKEAGCTKLLIDAHEPKGLSIEMIKFLLLVMKKSQEMGIRFAMIGNGRIVSDCQGFEDTRDWTFFETPEQARNSLNQTADNLAPLAAS